MNNHSETIIKRRLRPLPFVLACSLFGSFVKNMQRNDSDIDIAVIVDRADYETKKHVQDLFRDISLPADLDLSVVDRHASPLLLYEIVTTGKVIYTRNPDEWTAYVAYVLRRYWDTAHMRNIYYAAVAEKFLSYGNT